MYYPTTRVLTVLELLQSHQTITGAEIARRLEVDIRTARRYVEMLEDLGIPVTADRGRFGGYRLVPGYKLPPLMLNEGEALALTLGLLAARRLGLAAQAPAVESALAKVERVLPEEIRRRVNAVEETLVWDTRFKRSGPGPDSEVVLTLSTAARERRRVNLSYRRPDGDETQREFDPYGLACQGGSWYATGHCHLRGGMRLFRLDRVMEVELLDDKFVRPVGFDVLESVLTSLGSVPKELAVEVVLNTTLERARWHVSARVAVLEEIEGGVLLRGYTDHVDWLACLLAGLGCDFVVRTPVELTDALRRLSQRVATCADTCPNPS